MSDYRNQRRSAIDPARAGAEAVAAGYRTVESVFDVFADSLRRRPGPGYAREAPPPSPGRRTRADAPGGGTGSRRPEAPRMGYGRDRASASRGLADLAVELIDLVGETLEGVTGLDLFEPDFPLLELSGLPGQTVEVKFWFTNTGPSALGGVSFKPSELVGAAAEIKTGAIDVKPDGKADARIRPGGSVLATAKVTIPPPGEAPFGIYRGVIAARCVAPAGQSLDEGAPDAWALLELEVAAPDPNRPMAPTY
jgi:hypothetical protein